MPGFSAEAIICFENVSRAIMAEQALAEKTFSVKVMPMPASIRSGCGFCLRFLPEDIQEAATMPALSETVLEEVRSYLGGIHLNAGRNFQTIEKKTIALRARRAVANLFCVEDPLRVIFTSGATASLNMAINGLVRPGDHVLATSIEQNATARPLHLLRKNGVIDLEWLQCEPDGSLEAEKVRSALRNP